MNSIEESLKQHGFELPHAPAAIGAYIPVVKTGSLIVTSGQLPIAGKEVMFTGKLGAELHDTDGQNAACLCLINALAQIKNCINDLSRIEQIVRLEGYVNSAPGFTQQPHVLNAASELLLEAFGEKGRHSRIAVGVNELPLNAAVELALWVQVAED